ncbi:MAG: FtsX-like permease family protein [Calditrichaeota bacterium]|nr:MAG: FtsX-like permease family protein [Calditrichota bacterium]
MIRHAFALVGEYAAMAWHSIVAHKLRSFLTTLGIFIGVTTIITIWTTIQGLNSYITNTLGDISSSVVYVEKFPWVISNDFWKYRNRKNITWREYQTIRAQSRLAKTVTPQVMAQRVISHKEKKLEGVAVLGTTETFMAISSVFPESGRFFTAPEVRGKHNVCVLGAELSRSLFDEETPLGKRVRIGDRRYTVIGVLEKQGEFFGQSRDNFAIVPIGTFRNVFGMHRGLQIAVQAADAGQLDDLKEELRGILRRERKVAPGKEDDFAINQQDQLTDLYEKTTSTLYAIIIVIAGISLLVGGIGITNIMLVSVTERTREIGLRKAVGARRRNIMSQFLMESVTVAVLGGMVGILPGVLVGQMILSVMTVEGGVPFSAIALGFLFSALTGIVSGFYPAWKAARMNPIDALRYA